MGGYDKDLGGVKNVTLKDNTITNNDLNGSQGGQLLLPYNIENLAVINNQLTNSISRYVIVSNPLDKNALRMEGNRYIRVSTDDQQPHLPLL